MALHLPTHWTFKNLLWVGAGTEMRSQYLPADDMATVKDSRLVVVLLEVSEGNEVVMALTFHFRWELVLGYKPSVWNKK